MWYDYNFFYYTIIILYMLTDKCRSRKSLYLTLEKRNKQLEKLDKVITELKQELKDKDQESGIVLHNLNWLIN